MKLTYHPQQNIAYLSLREKPGQVETIRLSDEVNIDIAPDGSVCGIELLNANEQLDTGRQRELLVVNEASGETTVVRLAV